jgi:hypothetical protein
MTCDLHTGCARHHLPPLVARFSGPHLGAGARGHQRLRRRGDDFALPCAVGRSAFRRKPPLRPSLLSRLCWCVHTAQCWWASNVVAIQSSCTEHSVTKRSGVKKRPTIEAKETYCRGKRDLAVVYMQSCLHNLYFVPAFNVRNLSCVCVLSRDIQHAGSQRPRCPRVD